MTIFFPDLSRFDTCDIQIDTTAVICKATQGTSIIDAKYFLRKEQAGILGVYFTAYHWLNAGNAISQAIHCHGVVGDVPLMIDAEDVLGNTGYTRALTVGDIISFAREYRNVGGTTHLVYLPHWYWQNNMGSPDLTPLTDNGLYLVSSNYRTYSDAGAGWDSYGNVSPVQWQYTNSFHYGGDISVDFNAFKGTLDEYKALTQGIHTKKAGQTMLIAQDNGTGQLYLCNGIVSRPINSSALGDIKYLANQGLVTLSTGTGPDWDSTGTIRKGWYEDAFGAVPKTPTVSISDDQLKTLALNLSSMTDPTLIETALRNVLHSV